MIRPLRSAHLGMFVGLAFVLPAVFVAGLAVRKPVPVSAASAPALEGKRFDLASKDYRFQFILAGSELQFTSGTHALHPDVLVYVSDAPASFPSESRLVGPMRIGPTMNVPAGDFLVFYSLGHRKVISSARIGSAR